MGWFDFLRKKEASVPLFSTVLRGMGFSSTSSTKGSDYYRGWVYSCVQAIAQEIGKIDLVLLQEDSRGNEEVVTKHKALELLNYVNPYFTKFTLFERLAGNLELEGDEFWYIEYKGGVPFEIYPLNPRSVKPIQDAKEYVSGYEYQIDSKKIRLGLDEVIHFKTYNPSSDIKGLSTIEAVRQEVDTDNYAREYNKSFFVNGAIPGLVIEMPGTLTETQREKLENQVKDKYTGVSKSYKTFIAHGGMKVQTLQLSHSDMEYLEGRRFNRDQICAIFRVPKTVLGASEAETNRATAETADYVFVTRTVLPKMARIVDTLNEFLLPLFGDPKIKFRLRNEAPKNLTEEATFVSTMINSSLMTINEGRARFGLPPVENGNFVLAPFSLSPYGQVEAQKTSEISSHKSPMFKAIEGMVDEVMVKVKAGPQKKEVKLVGGMDESVFEEKGLKKYKSQTTRAQKIEPKFEKAVSQLFNGQKERVKDELKKVLNDRKAYKSKKFDLLDADAEVKATIDLFTPLMANLFEAEGQAAYDALGIEDDFVITPEIKKFIERNTKKLAGSMTDTTSTEIRKIIVEGIEAGEGIDELTSRIDDYAGFGDARAQMIAITEVSRGQNQAELKAWEESGVVASVVWYTAEDERVDDQCADLHGKEIDLGDDFLSVSEMGSMGIQNYNGAIDGPPLHPSCRCVLLPVVNGKSYHRKEVKEEDLIHELIKTL